MGLVGHFCLEINMLTAERDGTVAALHVKVGDVVPARALLMELG